MKRDENDEEIVDNIDKNSHNSADADVEIVEDEEEKNPRDTIAKLRAALKTSQKERQEFLELSQRLKADSVNQKREGDKWREEFVKFAEEKLLMRLLPVLESFSLATGNKEAWEALPKDWRIGMEYIERELVGALSEHGLTEINPQVGDKIDPRLHATVASISTDDALKDHTVSSVAQKGFVLNGKVLKPAKVTIAEYSK